MYNNKMHWMCSYDEGIIAMNNKKTFLMVLIFAVLFSVGIIKQTVMAVSNESDFIFDKTSGTITGYKGSGGVVEIPSQIGGVNVTSIGAYAFMNNNNITNITIPSTVTTFKYGAFYYCDKLTDITIPDSVTEITGAFIGCSKLTGINIPNNVKVIGTNTFWECESLTNIVIPSSVTSIAIYAFGYCRSLKYAYFKGNAPTMDSYSFDSPTSDFVIYYNSNSTGFSNPTWQGYKTISVSPSTSKPAVPAITSPADGSFTNDNRVLVTGTATPGATVSLNFEDDSWHKVVADKNGNWSYKLPVSIHDGSFLLYVSEVDLFGNPSDMSQPVRVVIDTTPPDPPVITVPSNGISIKNLSVIVFGHAEPHSQIHYYINTYDFGTIDLEDSSFFNAALTSPLPEGTYNLTITATATDRAGNTSSSSVPVTYTINPSSQSVVLLGTPNGSFVSSNNKPLISGITDPNTNVYIVVNNKTIATITSDEDGYFGCIPDALSDGDNYINAAIVKDGKVIWSNDGFIRIDTVGDTPIINLPVKDEITNNNNVVVTGTSESGAFVYIYFKNADTADEAVYYTYADNNGNWTYSVNNAADGRYTIAAKIRDNVSNYSERCSPVNITIDTIKPSIKLNGTNTVTIHQGMSYKDEGAAASDNIDGDISANIAVTGSVDTSKMGLYTLTYNVHDAAGNNADAVTRTITVIGPMGDLDGDGLINAKDGQLMKEYLLGKPVVHSERLLSYGDFDGDGRITSRDYAKLLEIIYK